jgi:hypothetical protein
MMMSDTLRLFPRPKPDTEFEALVTLWENRLHPLWEKSTKEAQDRFVEWLEEKL